MGRSSCFSKIETCSISNDAANTKRSLSYNRKLLMENFILPNRLKFPLFRNILDLSVLNSLI